MVEYALILAHDAIGTIALQVNDWVAEFGWQVLLYCALAFVAWRIAIWAFRLR